MKIKQIKITNTITGRNTAKELTEEQYQNLLDDKRRKELPLKFEIIREREL